ncbi:MAG: hypothetical protein Q8L20_03245 [Gammaproteobacteria bacterium]|nr:hypothetical protein [Gammaproteobacteria bacterium]
MQNNSTGIALGFQVTVAATTVISLTIALWRTLYSFGDISVVSLIPLALLMLVGSYITILGARRASLDSILTETTGLRTLLKGRIISAILSLIITAGGIFLVAYKGLVSQPWEQIVGVSCVVSTSIIFLAATRSLSSHVNQKYLLSAATNVTVWIAGTVFFFVYLYALWNIQSHRAYLLSESLPVSISLALNELPQGYGFGAVLVEIATVVEVAKDWAVVNTQSIFTFSPIVYATYGAVFGYFQTRVISSVICAILIMLKK